MFLDKLKVMNLWNDSSIELEFDEKITILTGVNGSGKSSVLNIIYDSLTLGQNDGIATSKNRLWISECTLTDGTNIQSLVIPSVPESKQKALTNVIQKYNNKCVSPSFYDQNLIDEIKATYEDSNTLNHVVFSKKNVDGQGSIHGVGFPASFTEEKKEEIHRNLTNRPNAFLFQEDRKVMHNLENSNIDPNLEFWNTYSSSIDTRFFYIRDAMQIRESQIDAKRSELIDTYEADGNLDGLRTDDKYQSILNKKKAVADLFNLLNEYFHDAGKVLVKDKDDNKVTLKYISNNESISWHLLSRGEKTLIYLFFVTFLYQDKISLFLFDEPDVALHVKWQERLLKDLSTLAPYKQFIIATHSPSLVMKGWMENCLTIKVF